MGNSIRHNITINPGVNVAAAEDVWEKVWTKDLITSDYSLKYLAYMADVERHLPKNSAVLEAGCGTGQTLGLFSGRHETYGLDISRAALDLAKENCQNPLLGSIFSIPVRNDTFDLVYNSGVIEHFRDPTNVAAIKEMARVARPSGKIIIIVPNTLCLWYRLGKHMAVMMRNFEFGYEEDYSYLRLRDAAQRAGLIIEDTFGLQALPPLATNDREIAGVRLRKRIGRIEVVFPLKQFYAYTVGIVARKPE